MKTFAEQLAATQQRLDALAALATRYPDLFADPTAVSIAQVDPESTRVYLHGRMVRDRDWRAWASQCPANWKRRSSSQGTDYFDYDGELDGVSLCIIEAEPREQPQPLFAASKEAA